MKLKDFQSDQEIVIYLKQGINEIVLLNECRLTREEQLQLTQ